MHLITWAILAALCYQMFSGSVMLFWLTLGFMPIVATVLTWLVMLIPAAFLNLVLWLSLLPLILLGLKLVSVVLDSMFR